ncbi:MAG: SUF system Fe-S cluster assembly regulator [Planctomycetota bacterium]
MIQELQGHKKSNPTRFQVLISTMELLVLRISRQTDYGIFILSSMVARSHSSLPAGDEALSSRIFSAPEIAQSAGLALPTVSKILKILARGGILQSRRGVQGGYLLSREPENISIQEIIEVLEGPISLTECADSGPDECGVGAICPMSENWRYINDRIRETLEKITLAQMAVPNGILALIGDQDLNGSLGGRNV